MFAAASGARLAHRHNKATIKKQLCTNNVEGLQAHYKAFERKHANYSDTPGIHGQRKPQRCYHNYTSKLYSSDSESVSKLSSSYIDLHGRIPKFGHVDFEGKAAWQDRELGYHADRRESVGVNAEAALSRVKQKEAHKRWVKRNRIHDSTFGDCSSEDEEAYGAYGVQSTAANALLYIGLGTMCIGMIIAFVGTGEKGFKTIELRLIGPSLIGAGVMITILRVMLCVCPSKCLKFKRHKLKNSTNKLNSEDECEDGADNPWRERGKSSKTEETLPMTDRGASMRKSESKKRVSIFEMPATTSSDKIDGGGSGPGGVGGAGGTGGGGGGGGGGGSDGGAGQDKVFFPGKASPKPDDKSSDVRSIGSDTSLPSHQTRLSEIERKDWSNQSELSLNSQINGFLNSDSFDSEMSSKTVKNASKFESQRSPKNAKSEILLNPSHLNELNESE